MKTASENIFEKIRERYDEIAARAACKTLIEETLDHLWALSDDDLADLISRHNGRNKTNSHRLSMVLNPEKWEKNNDAPLKKGV